MKNKIQELEDSHGKVVECLIKATAVEKKFGIEINKIKQDIDKNVTTANKLKEHYHKEEDDVIKDKIKSNISLLLKKIDTLEKSVVYKKAEQQSNIVSKLHEQVSDFTHLIEKTKEDLTNKEASYNASVINKEISKELSSININGLSSQIEEINQKIDTNNAEAEAWVDVSENNKTDDEKINDLLDTLNEGNGDDKVDDFLNS